MVNKFKQLLVEEEGQGMTEYGLILGAIAVLVVGILVFFRPAIEGIFNDIVETISGVASVD